MQRGHNKTFAVLVLITMIGIKALFFGNKDNNTKLSELNEELNNMYKILAEEEDSFGEKRNNYERDVEAIISKKNEVDNRIDYLNGVKGKISEQLAQTSSDLEEFKALCEQYVVAFHDVQEAQTELHGAEVELENSYASWDDECKIHETHVNNMQKDIQVINQKIAKINRTNDKKK